MLIEEWDELNAEGKNVQFPGQAYGDKIGLTCPFKLGSKLREDCLRTGRVSTSSFVAFQTQLYCAC